MSNLSVFKHAANIIQIHKGIIHIYKILPLLNAWQEQSQEADIWNLDFLDTHIFIVILYTLKQNSRFKNNLPNITPNYRKWLTQVTYQR